MNEVEDFHFKFKIVIIGDQGVGKTTFLDAITQKLGRVVENEQSGELHIKSTYYVDDNYMYKVVYFDLPGKDRHHKYIHKLCTDATAAIFLFDTSKRSTFERMENWLLELDKCDIPVKVLVGNKIDLSMSAKKDKSPLNKSEASQLANKYGIEYFETSSVGEASIVQVFDYLFNSLLSLIVNPADFEGIMGKNILVGRRLYTDPKFKLALMEMLPNYE